MFPSTPDWICSYCKKGKLDFKQQEFLVFETNDSKLIRENKKWTPAWIEEHFIGSLTCNKCNEVYSIAGEVSTVHNARAKQVIMKLYAPKYIFPVVHIFALIDDLPFEIEDAIVDAFKLFWISPSACANAIRTSIEKILTQKKIPKTSLTSKKKRRKLSLHERIEVFKIKDKEVADYLMAVKWIGNAGSHDGDLLHDDLLDGFEILQLAIEKLYSTHEKEISELSKAINKKKKPC